MGAEVTSGANDESSLKLELERLGGEEGSSADDNKLLRRVRMGDGTRLGGIILYRWQKNLKVCICFFFFLSSFFFKFFFFDRWDVTSGGCETFVDPAASLYNSTHVTCARG